MTATPVGVLIKSSGTRHIVAPQGIIFPAIVTPSPALCVLFAPCIWPEEAIQKLLKQIHKTKKEKVDRFRSSL
jgi:hypothetical protein